MIRQQPPTWPSASHIQIGPSKVFTGKGACDRSKKWARDHGYTMVAYDVSDSGAKNYLVSTWEDIFSIHQGGRAMNFPPQARRWLYEGIFYGPCIPFFDLDGEAYENPGLLEELDSRTQLSMRLISRCFRKVFGLSLADSDFLVFDASNDKKFSRHLLIRKKGVYFENLYQHARFTSVVRDRVLEITKCEKHSLTVLKTDKGMEKGIWKSLIDLSVYKTGLQLFRLFDCAKRNSPNRPLRRAKMCTYRIPHKDIEATFLASFVGRIDEGDGTAPNKGLRVRDEFIGPEGIVCYGGNALTGPAGSRKRPRPAGVGPGPTRFISQRTDQTRIEAPDPRYDAIKDYLATNHDTEEWEIFRLLYYKTTPRSGLYVIYPRCKNCAIRKKVLGNSKHENGNPYICLYRTGSAMYKCHSGSCKANAMPTMSLVRYQVRLLWPPG